MFHRRCYPSLFLVLMLAWSLSAQELTFVAINVWSGLDYKGTLKMGEYESRKIRLARYGILLEELRTINPDVIALNEANPLPKYARKLARDLGYDYIYNVGMAGIKLGCLGIPVNFREGDAILARKALHLKKAGVKRLSPGSGYIGNCFAFHFAESNQAIAGRISVGAQSVYVVNTHLHAGLQDDERWLHEMGLIRDSGSITDEEYNQLVSTWRQSVERRQSETRELLQWLDQTLPEDAPNVLMGDFNAVPTAQEIRWLLAEDYVDTWARMHGSEPGFTWDPNLNLNIQIHYHLPEPDAPVPWYTKLNAENEQIRKRIDYIFVKNVPPGYIQRSEIVFEQPVNGLHPSDHFGVLAVIRFDLTQ